VHIKDTGTKGRSRHRRYLRHTESLTITKTLNRLTLRLNRFHRLNYRFVATKDLDLQERRFRYSKIKGLWPSIKAIVELLHNTKLTRLRKLKIPVGDTVIQLTLHESFQEARPCSRTMIDRCAPPVLSHFNFHYHYVSRGTKTA